MTMTSNYENQSHNEIRNEVKKAFNKIDSYWTRDDQEIWEGAQVVLKNIKKKMDPKNEFDKNTLKKIENLNTVLQNNINRLKTRPLRPFSDNFRNKWIDDLAGRIDAVENDTIQDIKNFLAKQEAEKQEKEVETILKKDVVESLGD